MGSFQEINLAAIRKIEKEMIRTPNAMKKKGIGSENF